MNQYHIGYTVFYITALAGKIRIDRMRIIGIHKDRQGIYYTGIPLIEFNGDWSPNPEEPNNVLREKVLHGTHERAFKEIQEQLTQIRAQELRTPEA